MPNLTLKQWIYVIGGIVLLDVLIFTGIAYFITIDYARLEESEPIQTIHKAVPAINQATPLVWAGPPPTSTPTATVPPTAIATLAFSDGNFTSDFVPTLRPVSDAGFDLNLEGVMNSIQRLTIGRAGKIPIINQLLYPEPFFPSGYNNACGPVGLYAALKGAGLNISYKQVRDVAVNYGFGAHGISTTGMYNTAAVINRQVGHRLTLEQRHNYQLNDLTRLIRQGSVVVVLVRVKRGENGYHVTGDRASSFGHFLVVERVNTLTRRVKIAGSTLGMQHVPLDDFLRSWSSNPPPPRLSLQPQFTLNFLELGNQKPVTPIKRDNQTSGGGWAMAIRQR